MSGTAAVRAAPPRGLPRLHVVTDDAVLAATGWRDRALALLERTGPAVALHVRGPRTSASILFEHVSELAEASLRTGSLLLVNDRVDVALAAGLPRVHLGRRSLSASDARDLLGPGSTIGTSAHDAAELEAAAAEGVDYVLLGAIFPTPSHPDAPGLGLDALRRARTAAPGVPLVAIGGIGVEQTPAVVGTGAHGVAVVRGVWSDDDPAGAAVAYVQAIEEAVHER